MKTDKIIFLDIDGVLNSRKWYYARSTIPKEMFQHSDDRVNENDLRELDLTALGLLCKLVINTGSKIVISSTWRMGKDPLYFRLLFNRRGIDFPRDVFIGCTPILSDVKNNQGEYITRGSEIQKWIDEHNFTGKYVIFDDDSDFLLTQMPHFIQTTYEEGLLYEHYYKALCILEQLTFCDDCTIGWIMLNDDYPITIRTSTYSKYLNNFSNCRYDIYYNCSSCGKKIDL